MASKLRSLALVAGAILAAAVARGATPVVHAEAAKPVAVAARRVSVAVTSGGYTPRVITAGPGEPLVLAVTRAAGKGCIQTLRLSDGRVFALPVGVPVEIPITAPRSGELHFGCDVARCHAGAIVVRVPAASGT